MIVREATPADIRPLAAFIRDEFEQRGNSGAITPTHLRHWVASGLRLMAAWDPDPAAAIGAYPVRTDLGPGHEIAFLVTDHRHPDRLLAIDTIVLYASNISASEGSFRVTSGTDLARAPTLYGRDYVDMVTTVAGRDPITKQPTHLRNTADVRVVVAAILRRRPQWQLP